MFQLLRAGANEMLAQWSLVGFLIFFVLFLIFIATTFLPAQIALYKKLERLPLEGRTAEEKVP